MATRTRAMEPLFVQHGLGPIRTQTQDFSNYQWLHYIEINEKPGGRRGGGQPGNAAGVTHRGIGSVIRY
jgi:hypothetical protein